MTVTCKFCNKSLKVEDLQFKKYEARRAIETLGVVTVEKKGIVNADRVLCGGLIVRGKLRGDVTSRGPVLVGPEAEIKGDVTAPHAGRRGRGGARRRLRHRHSRTRSSRRTNRP